MKQETQDNLKALLVIVAVCLLPIALPLLILTVLHRLVRKVLK
jgi:hypothetical protein